jgi:hypothetical protein
VEISFTGGRLVAGVPIGEVNTALGIGRGNDHFWFIDGKDTSSVGLSLIVNHFTLEVPCNCALQPGDWIEISSVTILFVNVGSVTYHLCGGACTGKISSEVRGFGVGLEGSTIRWVFR